jgi:uncharacterized protein YdcH (DUF465 family)
MEATHRGHRARRGNSIEKEICPNMDRKETEEIKTHLMQTSEGFRELARQHQLLDAQVAQLERLHPTEDDEIEEHRLKKLKLRLKDQMEEMVCRYKTQHV